ncbi:MAG: hypothetical protein JJD97_08315 [Gemmatimonadaceae bacterium]|nr:hypothetical protein [Gemmatimonadaceae bacterium]
MTAPFSSARMLSLPLRITADGQLERTDPVTSLLAMVQAMAATSRQAWPHAPWFGLQELFAEASPDVQEHPRLVAALNASFAGLGIAWARVSAVRRPPSRTLGERNFDITLLVDGKPAYGNVAASSPVSG